MNPAHLALLRSPRTGNTLILRNETYEGSRVRSGVLLDPIAGEEFPIVNFIPRFVPIDNYAKGFGYQWTVHNRTQYDDTSKFDASSSRFALETRWPARLDGEFILEIGSGSGRFTKEAIKSGAMVVTCDFSIAVEANYLSNGAADNLLIVQASIFEMPFERGFYDKAFCFGVLQHTPDPERAFYELPKFVKPGGKIVSDIYIKDLTHWLLQPKYWIRPFTRGRNPEKLYRRIKAYVDFMWPLCRLLRQIPVIGPALSWKLLVADYSRELPSASEEILKEWAYLDSMDMLSPMYDFPKTVREFRKWHTNAALIDIDVHRGFNGIEGRATVAR